MNTDDIEDPTYSTFLEILADVIQTSDDAELERAFGSTAAPAARRIRDALNRRGRKPKILDDRAPPGGADGGFWCGSLGITAHFGNSDP